MLQIESTAVEPREVFELAAQDPEFFCRAFFPETFRQDNARFQREMWDILEDQQHRYVALEVFRGGAKTTTLRAFTAKRIAFSTSRTVMFVSASQEHSMMSLNWLRNQIERNTSFATTFGLEKGVKWTDSHFEVVNRLTGKTTNVLAVGITGQTRGFNIDDYRPDLIVVDDPCNEENTATPEARAKVQELFFTSLEKSLTPPTENPDAKMVLLQTSLDQDDLINQCHKDQSWCTRRFSCFDENGKSIWESRFPTSFLLERKQSHVEQNLLHFWLREMECTITSPEDADFRPEWIQFWTVLPQSMVTYLAIDPVPPPSEKEIALGMKNKDYECLAVVGVEGARCYLLEYAANRGHDPGWTVANFFRLVERWQPMKARVEGIAYQRTLKWILDQEMKKRGQYVQVNAVTDKRKKRHRITQAVSKVASTKRLYIHSTHHDFYKQFLGYPNLAHDDVIDAVSMALDEAESWIVNSNLSVVGQQALPPLESLMDRKHDWRRSP